MKTYLINATLRAVYITAIPAAIVLLLLSIILSPLAYILTGNQGFFVGVLLDAMDKIDPHPIDMVTKNRWVLTLEMNWDEYTTVLCFMNDSTGTVCITNYPDEQMSVIHDLYVKQHFRRNGIATKLLSEAGKYADYPITIWVHEDAPDWIYQFYEKRGYKVNTQPKI